MEDFLKLTQYAVDVILEQSQQGYEVRLGQNGDEVKITLQQFNAIHEQLSQYINQSA